MPQPPPPPTIVAFRRDEAGDWIADLSCGHSQHVRHRPPWQLRPWVQTESGRAAKLGVPLHCPLCITGGSGSVEPAGR